jgi:hypothetical protein
MTLEYSDVLQTLAQVAITLAGFIGLILVFQQGNPSTWTRPEKNTSFHLLYTSLGVFALSLLPILIQPGFDDSTTIWRICSPVLGIAHVIGATRALFENRRAEITIPIGPSTVFVVGSYAILLATVTVALGYLLEFAALIYLVGLGWFLAVSVAAFISLLFRGAES